MLTIRWQRSPLSGKGAAQRGGRWNARGMPALYLAAEHETAVAEYQQELLKPGTLAPYRVKCAKIADLTKGSSAALGEDWKAVAKGGGEPEGWRVARVLHAAGIDGALVPSARNNGGTNLVLWRWGEEGALVSLIDPYRDLSA